MTAPRLEQICIDTGPTEALFSAWNRLPRLYEAGPLFVTTAPGELGTLRANELVRRLAIEQSVRSGNDYWCGARPKDNDQPFARPNECVLDAVERYETSPDLPFLWIEFPDARETADEMQLLRKILGTARTCRKRGVGRFEEERERWRKIGEQVGEALSTSAFDSLVEAWSPSVVGDDTAKKLGRAGTITDTVENVFDFAEGLGEDGGEAAAVIPRGAAILARECLDVARASSFIAAPKVCGSSPAQPLFSKSVVPLVIAIEKVEWQGIACLEFLRAVVAACAKDPWPVVIVATTDNTPGARRILCSNIHATSATLSRLDARIIELPCDAVEAGKGEALPALQEAIERAQAFCLERHRALEADEQDLPDATAEAIRLRNEIARSAHIGTHPRLADVSFGLLGMALAGASRPPRPVWERLAILEAVGLQIQPWIQVALEREWPPEVVSLITETELLRLQDLFPLYRGILDLEGLRALCSEEGPLFALLRVYRRYGLDELPLFELFEEYLFEVSKLRPAALGSGETRANLLRTSVSEIHPELVGIMEARRLIRGGQAQRHLKKYAEAAETLALAAECNAKSGASKTEIEANARVIARISADVTKRLQAIERELDGGGMLRQTLRLFGMVWSGRPLTP